MYKTLLLILLVAVLVAFCLIIYSYIRKLGYKNRCYGDLQRGQELANYYQYLLDHPIPFVEYERAILSYLRNHSLKGLTPQQALCVSNLAGPQSAYGFALVEPGSFSFPQDHGPHWDIATSWYFFVAHLWPEGSSHDDKPISVVYVIKRNSPTPPMMWGDDIPLNHQIIQIYASVTFPDQGIREGTIRVVGGNTGRVKLQASPFLWKVDEDGLEGLGDSIMPLRVYYNDAATNVKIDLTLTASKPFFLEGDKGCDPCVYGLGYRYYSFSLLQATGSVVAGDRKANVTGIGWMDHQYGSGMEPLGYFHGNDCIQALANVEKQFQPPGFLPMWNWYCIQLNNKVEITVAIGPAPNPLSGTAKLGPYSLTMATLIDVDATYRNVTGTATYIGWIKNSNGNWYPSGTNFSFDDEKIELELTPTTMDQFGFDGKGLEYFEGGCLVTGTYKGNPIKGVGFLEMVGYQSVDTSIGILLNNAAISVTDPMVLSIFTPKPPSQDLVNESLIKLSQPECKK